MIPRLAALLTLSALLAVAAPGDRPQERLFTGRLNTTVPPIQTDRSVKYDFDIVYVRARRDGDKVHKRYYADIATPVTMEPGADLMLLKPDGTEHLLVPGGDGAVTDPSVSFDGQWVYYTLIHTLKGAGPWQPPLKGADIYKIHVPTRKVVRLTHQTFTPNTGAADWSRDSREAEKGKTHLGYGVLNFGAFPLPGGRIVFTSNRNAFRPPKGYPRVTLQLFVMDDDGSNVECIGHLNLAGALHPVTMRDGRVLFSSLENQGIRGDILWGIWSIHPDGSNWGPLVSAFDPGGAPNAFHFQTQLSDGSIVVEGYYNQNNSGFGTYIKLPESQPYPAFGPGNVNDPLNRPWRMGRHDNGRGKYYRMPFMPLGSEMLTPFARIDDGPADFSDPKDRTSPRVGKFTHPSGAPDNHLLTVYSPGPVNHQYTYLPQLDGGIYLIKDGKPIDEPAQMLLIKNDPRYNEQWPRALVPYERIYGVKEPKALPRVANDGKASKHLPEGTPFALVGSASLLKRESYPNGKVVGVTAEYTGKGDAWKGLDAFTSHGNGMPLNWHNQGADAGLYTNDDVYALRVVAMEPSTDRNRGPKSGKLFHTHAGERLRVLGEFPVRKRGGTSPRSSGVMDPDGLPDTSFLAKLPADVPFTFQTLDRDGMLLNMAQTWHQLRPGEVRHDCGGCHAHSQKPTDFTKTAAASPDYEVWDLVKRTPLLTAGGAVRDAGKVASVEYHRDIKPIFQRSCVACHSGDEPAGKLNLDAPEQTHEGKKHDGTYFRLALDGHGKHGHKPVGYDSWGYPQASRYVRKFQSRRSLLVWKVYGKRLDGFANDDHPSETEPGSGKLSWKGKEVETGKFKARLDIDYVGAPMPPPAAVKAGKVKPLTDEDRRALTRWIDLGCPIELDPDGKYGFACDDTRPTLTVTEPRPGANAVLSRVLIGMHDYNSGLAPDSLRVTLDVGVDGVPAGKDAAGRFKSLSPGVWEWRLSAPPKALKATLKVSVKDRQGNVTEVERRFRVGG